MMNKTLVRVMVMTRPQANNAQIGLAPPLIWNSMHINVFQGEGHCWFAKTSLYAPWNCKSSRSSTIQNPPSKNHHPSFGDLSFSLSKSWRRLLLLFFVCQARFAWEVMMYSFWSIGRCRLAVWVIFYNCHMTSSILLTGNTASVLAGSTTDIIFRNQKMGGMHFAILSLLGSTQDAIANGQKCHVILASGGEAVKLPIPRAMEMWAFVWRTARLLLWWWRHGKTHFVCFFLKLANLEWLRKLGFRMLQIRSIFLACHMS